MPPCGTGDGDDAGVVHFCVYAGDEGPAAEHERDQGESSLDVECPAAGHEYRAPLWSPSGMGRASLGGSSASGLPPPTCSPPPSPPSPPPTPAHGQILIREGAHRGDILRTFASGDSFQLTYEVGRMIGEGGFGKVFAARHRVLKLDRAVKRLRHQGRRTVAHRNELAALLSLDHPHIVKLVESYQQDPYLYLVFELCKGPDLFDRVVQEDRGKMSEIDASVSLRHMLKALQCCHSKYRGHFDIKPENFMFSDTHLTDLKMIDLGMSSGYDLHRRKHKIKGTAAYMAPELWRGNYGPEADIWSCGIVLFIMLTGEPALPTLAPATMKCESKLADLLRRRFKFAARTHGLSAKALDLLGLMLQHDRHGRPTVREALKHPFCEMSCECERASPPPRQVHEPWYQDARDILESLPDIFRSVAKEPMLKRVARLAMAHHGDVCPAQHMAFRMLDWHGYGELSVSVLERDLASRGIEVPTDMDQLFQAMDLLREGYISFLAFLSATLPADMRHDEALCRVAFAVLDRNKDGFLDAKDLESVFGNEQICRGKLGEVSHGAPLSRIGFLHVMRADTKHQVSLTRG